MDNTSTLTLKVASKRTDKVFRDGGGLSSLAGPKKRYITTFLLEDGTKIESYSRDYYVYIPLGMTVKGRVLITRVDSLGKTFYDVISVEKLRESKKLATNAAIEAMSENS